MPSPSWPASRLSTSQRLSSSEGPGTASDGLRHSARNRDTQPGGMMDFSLSPELTQLRARVRALVDDVLQPIEDEAERNHGRLSAETHARIHQAVLDSGLGANNIPKEFGGGGFDLTEQIVTHEQLGRLTNCLWVLVWSPSNVLVHGTPEQIERYLLPDVRGEHRHAYAITEGDAGSDPARDRGRGGLERRALRALRGQVVRDRRRRRLVLHRPGVGRRRQRAPAGPVPRRQGLARRRDDRRSRLHPQLPVPPPRVHVHEDARPAREHPRRARARLRAHRASGSSRSASISPPAASGPATG